MTRDDRVAARKRCEAATPGPWKTDFDLPSYLTPRGRNFTIPRTAANRAFMAAARTDLPAALDALDKADGRIAELEAAMREVAELREISPLTEDTCRSVARRALGGR